MASADADWRRVDPDGRFARAIAEVMEGCLSRGLLNRDVAHDVATVMEGMDVMASDELAWPGIRERVRALLMEDMSP